MGQWVAWNNGRMADTAAEAGRDLALQMHRAFNDLDLREVDEIFAADFYSHPLQGGPSEVKARWSAMRGEAPELRTEVVDVVAEGDRVFLRSRLSDGSGELFELFRISRGRIAELWGARN